MRDLDRCKCCGRSFDNEERDNEGITAKGVLDFGAEMVVMYYIFLIGGMFIFAFGYYAYTGMKTTAMDIVWLFFEIGTWISVIF